MKKVKTSELKGAALDWAVAKCEGMEVVTWANEGETYEVVLPLYPCFYRPSINWEQGGPIIEKHGISIKILGPGMPRVWGAEICCFDSGGRFAEAYAIGDTPLTAAMRCYVASRFCDEIEILERLI